MSTYSGVEIPPREQRHTVCFKCHPEPPSSRFNTGDGTLEIPSTATTPSCISTTRVIPQPRLQHCHDDVAPPSFSDDNGAPEEKWCLCAVDYPSSLSRPSCRNLCSFALIRIIRSNFIASINDHHLSLIRLRAS